MDLHEAELFFHFILEDAWCLDRIILIYWLSCLYNLCCVPWMVFIWNITSLSIIVGLQCRNIHFWTWQDWIWSVGCNPFSATSQGWHISQFQSDSIARSYVITTLEESIQLVNSAIHRLLMERTSILLVYYCNHLMIEKLSFLYTIILKNDFFTN
jgi:hypothetical protein